MSPFGSKKTPLSLINMSHENLLPVFLVLGPLRFWKLRDSNKAIRDLMTVRKYLHSMLHWQVRLITSGICEKTDRVIFITGNPWMCSKAADRIELNVCCVTTAWFIDDYIIQHLCGKRYKNCLITSHLNKAIIDLTCADKYIYGC